MGSVYVLTEHPAEGLGSVGPMDGQQVYGDAGQDDEQPHTTHQGLRQQTEAEQQSPET